MNENIKKLMAKLSDRAREIIKAAMMNQVVSGERRSD